jgi:DNA-binding NtrC family response regulator
MPLLAEPARSPEKEIDLTMKTVLVAQDEPDVRKLVKLILARQGYQVLEAANARAAIRHCVESDEPIHLLLSDGILPSMTLRQLAECVQGLRPGVKVLCMSGYSRETLLEEGAIQAETAFLQKPFLPVDLVRRVEDLLE